MADQPDGGNEQLIERLNEEIACVAGDLDEYFSPLIEDWDLESALDDSDFSVVQERTAGISAHLDEPPFGPAEIYLALARVFGDEHVKEADFSIYDFPLNSYIPSPIPQPLKASELTAIAAAEFEEPDNGAHLQVIPCPRVSSIATRVRECSEYIMSLQKDVERTHTAILEALNARSDQDVYYELRILPKIGRELGNAVDMWMQELNRLYVEDSGALGFAGEVLDGFAMHLSSQKNQGDRAH